MIMWQGDVTADLLGWMWISDEKLSLDKDTFKFLIKTSGVLWFGHVSDAEHNTW